MLQVVNKIKMSFATFATQVPVFSKRVTHAMYFPSENHRITGC